MDGIEAGVGGVWQAPQTAAGTIERPDATAMRRLRKDGDSALRAAKTTASQEYVDGLQWGSPTSYVDTIGGDVGTIDVQGQLEIAVFEWAQLLGSDIVTGSADPYTHTITSGTDVPVSQTFYQAAGATVGPIQQAFYDAKIARLTQNAGQDRKVLIQQLALMALFAGEWFGTPPTARDSGVDPLLWTEAVTRIDGVALPELSGDTIDADAGISVHRGQSASPAAWIYGKGQVVRTVDGVVTDGTLPHVLNALYGTVAPADGDPIADRVVYIDLSSKYVREAARRELTINTPRVEVRPDDFMLGPKAEGGRMDVAFGGRCFASATRPVITIVALTGDSRPYAA